SPPSSPPAPRRHGPPPPPPWSGPSGPPACSPAEVPDRRLLPERAGDGRSGVVDAEAGRRHGLEAGRRGRGPAHLAGAVGAGVELGQGPLDVLQLGPELAGEGPVLPLFGGHLAGVREVLVEAVAVAVEGRHLGGQLRPGVLELLPGDVVGGLSHGPRVVPVARRWRVDGRPGRSPTTVRWRRGCTPGSSRSTRGRAAPGRPGCRPRG